LTTASLLQGAERTLQVSATITQPQRSKSDPLAPPIWEITGLAALVCFYGIGDQLFGEPSYRLSNSIGPVWLVGVLGCGAYRMTRVNPNAVLTGLFWFRIATLLYFGIGSLIPSHVNLTTKLYVDVFFRAEPYHLFKLNLIVALSTLAVLSGAAVTARLWVHNRRKAAMAAGDRQLLPIGMAFAAIGFAIKLLVIIPFQLGAFGEEGLPGIVLTLGLLAQVALYMLTRYAVRYRPALLPVMVVVLLLDILTSVLVLNKSDATISLMMFVLAYLSQRISIGRLAIAAASIVAVFITIVPITDFGRLEAARRYGSFVGGALSERWEVIKQYYSTTSTMPVEEELQSGLARISYVNAGAFAIDRYDAGHPGPSIDNAWVIIIPRLLWPEKPVLTNIGLEFNAMATGNANSASAPGLFADAYWAMGWLGIPVLMLPLGVIFGLLARYSLWVIECGRWMYFPLVLLAMKIGLRVDGFYLTDVLGPLPILVFLHVGIWCIENVLASMIRPR
jgi:hypothetical protein